MRNFLASRPSPAMAVAFVALLAALSGTAIALPGTNTVDSGDIKNGQVRGKDIRRNAVTGAKVKNSALTGADVRNDSLTGLDINESTLGQVPSAATAGSANTANSATTANSANTAGDANTLDGQNSTDFSTASASTERSDNLALTAAFQDVLSTSITTSTESRVLATASLEVEGNGGGDDDAGCQIVIGGVVGPENNFTIPDTAFDQDTTSVAFGQVLPAGTHAVALQCDEAGTVTVDDAELIAFAIPT